MDKRRIRIEQHGGLGLLWCAGWLFTLGYLQLTFRKGVLAIFIWPYSIGVHLALPAASAAMTWANPLCQLTGPDAVNDWVLSRRFVHYGDCAVIGKTQAIQSIVILFGKSGKCGQNIVAFAVD